MKKHMEGGVGARGQQTASQPVGLAQHRNSEQTILEHTTLPYVRTYARPILHRGRVLVLTCCCSEPLVLGAYIQLAYFLFVTTPWDIRLKTLLTTRRRVKLSLFPLSPFRYA